MKRLAALLLALLMMTAICLAEIDWTGCSDAAVNHLQPYVEHVNAALATMGAGTIDVAYEVYSGFASLGMDGVVMPDDPNALFTKEVEMYFLMSDEGLYSLTLRASDIDRFAAIAAACLHAASPEYITLESALTTTERYTAIAHSDAANRAVDPKSITHGYEEEVEESPLQGDSPRAYFAYYPDQYGDEVNWLQMTLIFQRPGSQGGSLVVGGATPPPQTEDEEYEGYFSQDNYDHMETFATPTPEPDSAAMERW